MSNKNNKSKKSSGKANAAKNTMPTYGKVIILVAILVAVAAIVALVAVLTRDNGTGSPDSSVSSSSATGDNPASIGDVTAQADPGLYVDGVKVEDPSPMLVFDGQEVSFDMYRYMYLNYKSAMSSGDDTYWADDADGSKAANLLDTVEYQFRQNYTWLRLGRDMDISLTAEEEAELTATLAGEEAQEGFAEMLVQYSIPDAKTYEDIRKQETLVQKIYTTYTESLVAENEEEVKAGVISARHILIPFDEEETDTDKAEADAKAIADTIYGQIQAAADKQAEFAVLLEENNNDPGQTEEGYTFVEGDMMTEFYEGALALEPGEISEPIRTSYGYHIIMRLPLNETYYEENKATLGSNVVGDILEEKMQELEKEVVVEYGAYYDKVSVANMK